MAGAAQTAMLPGQGTGGWPELERLLARAMADVRLAVADFPAMSRLMRAAGDEIAAAPRGSDPAAAAEFLRWLMDENFVLLGHRRLDVSEGGVAEVAAHAVALNIAAIAFQIPLGIAQAATIRVGLAYGAADRGWIARAG